MTVEHNELKFENDLINHLVNLGGSKQWEYLPQIKTADQLWANFKHILEQHNQDRLEQPLSSTEFNQVKAEIQKQTKTPYEAGQFLYGINGISQVEIERDDGKHVYLQIFDQQQIGAGSTVYQIVNQIDRPAVIPGRKDRRFDVTMLINGLPIIQIEEKADGRDAKEALNQMRQYIEEEQYTDIFGTVQVLVALTPHDARYMANTTAESFNTDFAFQWQRAEDNKPVLDAMQFADLVLSIPMAHQMATNYMILDGTPKHKMIKIMRPYQVYSTKKVINKIREHTFGIDDQRIGYVWHTTGSGKTISSFKAAWLASKLPNVDKVVFMVDRIALTNQTVDEYKAYDPENTDDSKGGVVTDTANRWDLVNRLRRKGNGIIVTSTQKMDAVVRSKDFKAVDKNIVFIVDEAHRSTSGEMLQRIRQAFPKSAWVGYTGTPVFLPENGKSKILTTRDIFGDVIHTYTIQDAIKDGNVLGFKVDFETTLTEKVLREQYLPEYFKARYPKMTDEEVQERIANMNDDDMDDKVEPSVYDENPKHIQLVVKDILKNWNKRSVNGKYNAILTTHVGGGKASTPMAMEYYREFKKQNAERQHPLRIGITFSQDTSNSDSQLETNKSLQEAMKDYNKMFGTSFDDKQVKEYTEQVVSRLNRTINDGKYFDIVIVVDQLLTGFNAPQLNTLYVDRTLKGAALVQAYSRTNRVYDMQTKPFGRIINYRWPNHTEMLMKRALAKYANRNSASIQTTLFGDDGESKGVIAPSYDQIKNKLHKVVNSLASFSEDFTDIPASEAAQEQMYKDLRQYNHLMAIAKQDDRYDDRHPEKLLMTLGMSEDDEEILTTTLANRLKAKIAKKHHIDFSQVDLQMEHVKEVKVNWDYLEGLIAEVMNQYHNNNIEAAKKSAEEVKNISDKLEDRRYAAKILRFIDDIFRGKVKPKEYPVQQRHIKKLIDRNNNDQQRTAIFDYKKQWGLADIKDSHLVNEILERHVIGADDLNGNGELDNIVMEGQAVYKTDAESANVKELSKIKYRTHLRRNINEFADKLKKEY
ncbi:type I restriction endonuclease subunit R [Limosilactobacillus fastidiosus]|uniref:Type I restriction enzyme endonuclease subunit n=1 Tax=Limosilactobacillus fastidiosus TaxID=2759855 RepID=A0A7W3U0E9_9LACO|nr:HsdR family type I site-specific deoxyribonuclease [Limosilactobacillus fastidiosus]MBB1086632.1 type I restriction endonuclease subunit R [Limosilactobacillus fastidiosus]MCD7085103.1 HsdR family type I site-specific deoxyribonuclease [Limosilactobacillus fastidiosus]MCD7115315.1 HsdR family type I site-specific deoxyribonuclease [Limosilactobacillus fastidiosus]MCD7116972.1 HsdR family type I site-specific deoxyribonuclease [Limosilactobacillus fastidiosus]